MIYFMHFCHLFRTYPFINYIGTIPQFDIES